MDRPRLIERAFPLKQASIDSVHEKNVRHGHISTLHIWPARRPLAACRAALIATLLPDPGTPEERRKLCERIGGKVVEKVERKRMPGGKIVERVKEETEGGILHWKRETENADEIAWFREKIREAYGGQAPRVLDPFAGGGSIPLEAMRLGCEATAVDINPVAWFILKCTLEYPQKLAGKTLRLPDFIVNDLEFMEEFFVKGKGYSKNQASKALEKLGKPLKQHHQILMDARGKSEVDIEADLAWHVRAWGKWVLNKVRRDLARFYPTFADFEPLDLKSPVPYEKQPLQLVPFNEDGTPDMDSLNAEFTEDYLKDRRNPRWVAKPTVAYLWARTVSCKNCRATVTLLKTLWLCKKDNKRVALRMEPGKDGATVVFSIDSAVPVQGGNAAQRREHDRLLGRGTMSNAGAKCPFCATIMTMEDLRLEGKAGRLGTMPTAVIVEGQISKEYRLPSQLELDCVLQAETEIPQIYTNIPFGMPTEPMPGENALGMRIQKYGFRRWCDLFNGRQLAALGSFLKATRMAKEAMAKTPYSPFWVEAIGAYLASMLDRLANQNSGGTMWNITRETIEQTFARFALPMHWDYPEANVFSSGTGGYTSAIEWVGLVSAHLLEAAGNSQAPQLFAQSSTKVPLDGYDLIITDPPYYDAIPYSDLMDFFYVWLRRSLIGLSPEFDLAFSLPLGPKWDSQSRDGELIDDDSRHGGDSHRSKMEYEDGMARCFSACCSALTYLGRFVVVFANKQPDAWETLASAIIRSGFVVDGSWPIATERRGGVRNFGRASLSSSVWLICRKRPANARPGWDNIVHEEMRRNISERLHEYWDAGIRGPDFVWAATGPALEAYSKHPVVKKANDPNQLMTVSEFLIEVRRMVVDFVVGQVLSGKSDDSEPARADRLDAPTAYYLLHRHDFGMDEAPAGACILYATACGLSDRDIETTWDLLVRATNTGRHEFDDESDESDGEGDTDLEAEPETGGKMKLKGWTQRKGKNMGYEAPGGSPVPLIDRVHRLMHLWRAGEVGKVDEYLDDNGLRRQELFLRLVQSVIELAPRESEERGLLEKLSNHIRSKGVPVSFTLRMDADRSHDPV